MSKRIVTVALALLVVVGGIALSRYLSPDATIRRMFRDASSAVADERLLTTAGYVARSYSDPLGQSYESLLGALHSLFDSYDKPRLYYDLRQISRSGRTATVEVTFRLTATTGGRDQALIGSLLEPARAVLALREESGGWRIERAMAIELPGSAPGR